jgi:hypothetical protein
MYYEFMTMLIYCASHRKFIEVVWQAFFLLLDGPLLLCQLWLNIQVIQFWIVKFYGSMFGVTLWDFEQASNHLWGRLHATICRDPTWVTLNKVIDYVLTDRIPFSLIDTSDHASVADWKWTDMLSLMPSHFHCAQMHYCTLLYTIQAWGQVHRDMS